MKTIKYIVYTLLTVIILLIIGCINLFQKENLNDLDDEF